MKNKRKSLDDIDILKTNSTRGKKGLSSINHSKSYNNTKQQMRSICNALSMQSKYYKPEKTVQAIETYLRKQDKLDRILYSEISSHYFGMNSENQRGNFSSNVENLLLCVLDDKNKVNDDVKKISIKIYDHVQLATRQIENTSDISKRNIMEARNQLHDEIKGIEKEYITILGIFAAIVLAFVGGITFTTSVLQNIDKVSIFRLIITVDVIGAVLINVIYLLISFLLKINDKERGVNRNFIIRVNVAFLVIAVVVIIGWIFNINDIPGYVSKFLFWTSKQ